MTWIIVMKNGTNDTSQLRTFQGSHNVLALLRASFEAATLKLSTETDSNMVMA